MHGKFYPWRSIDADNHKDDGSKSGRNSLRQPFDQKPPMPDISRQQFGSMRGNGFINAITDGATNENPTKDNK